ncbi:hypothetical protein AB0H37_34990 [Actinomadura sp. NPDC023710]|uniref:hypothetical protein n=1 Tax=Actinomadura sp. NPDC023710 TaxID=3158219 RepID=UPI0033D30CE2
MDIVLNTKRMRAKILTGIPATASTVTIGLVSHAAHLTLTQTAPMVAVTISGAIATYFLGTRAATTATTATTEVTGAANTSDATGVSEDMADAGRRIENLEAEVKRLRRKVARADASARRGR